MKALLICPGPKSEVPLLSAKLPLSAVPMFGQSLVEYWLSDLAHEGVKEVMILASDRPHEIRDICGKGERWGLAVDVLGEDTELAPTEAILKYGQQLQCVPPNRCLAVLDHFPGFAQKPLYVSYAAWFKGLRNWLPMARTPERVGVREIEPGVFVGMQARIAPGAELHADCWIGRNVVIGERAVIGPGSIIEDRAFIERDAEVRSSYVGPDTYVGRYAQLTDAIAWGTTLVDWKSGMSVEIPDSFILSSLKRKETRLGWRSWLASRRRKQADYSASGEHSLR